MSWLKIDTCTPDKPEVWAIADALGIDADAAFGKLFRVWAWFDQHTESGNALLTRRALLDRVAGVTGFSDAMMDAGWLADDGGLLTLPNFERHNGQTAKARALTAKRVASHAKKANDQLTRQPLAERYLDKRRVREEEDKRRTEEKNPAMVRLATHDSSPAEKNGKPCPVPYSDDFAAFWHAYPTVRKKAKRKAWEAWRGAIKREQPRNIIQAAEEYAESKEGRGEFSKLPATWLNGDCWDDCRAAWDGRKKSKVATPEQMAKWNPIDGGGED